MFPAWSEKKSSKRKSEIYWKVNFRTLPQTLSCVPYMGVGKWGQTEMLGGWGKHGRAAAVRVPQVWESQLKSKKCD